MKKILSLVMAVMLLTLCAAPALAASNSVVYRYVYSQNGKSVNVRELPNMKTGKVLASIPYGTKIIVIENQGTWSHVNANGNYGYMMSRYLVKNKPAEKQEQKIDYSSFKKVRHYTATVHASRAGGYVNLRWAPSSNGKVIEKVYDGSKLIVIAQGNGWYQVTDTKHGVTGFMVSKFLKK